MVFSAVFTANLYNGLNTSAWTGWVFFAVFIGSLLVWVYTVSFYVTSAKRLLTTMLSGHLQYHSSWMVCHHSLRQQHLPVRISLFLVVFTHHGLPCSPPAISLQGVHVCLQSKRHRYSAICVQDRPTQRPRARSSTTQHPSFPETTSDGIIDVSYSQPKSDRKHDLASKAFHGPALSKQNRYVNWSAVGTPWV